MIDDYASAKFWADIGQWIFNALVATYLWINRRHNETLDKIESACEKIDEHERDISLLKSHPSHDQSGRMVEQIERMSGEISEIKGRLTGINRAVDLMNEYLIKRER